MPPPTVAIVVGVTAVVSLTLAFHKFVYEPHLASRFEVAIANWLESRRQKRRQAAAYREVPDEHDDDNRQDKPTDTTPPVEMDRMVKEEVAGWRSVRPLTLNEVDGSELRRRNTSNHLLEEESVWTLKPTIYEPLTPTLAASRAQSPPLMTMVSHTSTPSTIESSLLNLASPSSMTALSPSQNVPLRTLSPGSTQYDPLADSILSNPAHETLFSPDSSSNQSHVHISPRGLEVHLAPTLGVHEGEGNTNPLSQVSQPPITRSPRSPLASTIYESFTASRASRSPPSASPQVFTPQFVVHSPLSDSLSLVDHPTAPASTASWSDIGSAGAEGDRDELSFGSDAESWARARNVRRT